MALVVAHPLGVPFASPGVWTMGAPTSQVEVALYVPRCLEGGLVGIAAPDAVAVETVAFHEELDSRWFRYRFVLTSKLGFLQPGIVQFSVGGLRLESPVTVDVTLVESGGAGHVVPLALGRRVSNDVYEVTLAPGPLPGSILDPADWNVNPASMKVSAIRLQEGSVRATLTGGGIPVFMWHQPSLTTVSVCRAQDVD
jgi:hypothetical protein